MSPDEYRASLAALNLTQVGAGRLFRINERTSRRWSTGEDRVPASVELCLKLATRFGVNVDDLYCLLESAEQSQDEDDHQDEPEHAREASAPTQ